MAEALISNPGENTALVEMWRNNLRKSQQRAAHDVTTPTDSRPATLNFQWTGGGEPIPLVVDPITFVSSPSSCDPILLEVPFPSTIVWAHMYAGDAFGRPAAVSATVEVLLTSFLSFGATAPLNGTGEAPSLVFIAKNDVPLLGWQTNLLTGDAIIARLTSFSGLATWVALVLQIRPTSVPVGTQGIVDENGDTIVDEFGNPVVLRS